MENKKQYLYVILSYTEPHGKKKVILVKEDAVFSGAIEWLQTECFNKIRSNWLIWHQFYQLFCKINNLENVIDFQGKGRITIDGPWQGRNFGGMLLSGRFIFQGVRFRENESLGNVIFRIIFALY